MKTKGVFKRSPTWEIERTSPEGEKSIILFGRHRVIITAVYKRMVALAPKGVSYSLHQRLPLLQQRDGQAA